MTYFARVHAWLERFSRLLVWIGGGGLLLCAFMVTGDIIMRKLFSVTMSGSDEVSGYVFAVATTWAYSYCLLHRSNVRIDAFYNLVPVGLRAALDLIGLVLLLVYMAYLTSKSIDMFATSWHRDSVSITTLATPLWIPQLLWLAGLCWFVFTLIFMILYVVTSLCLRDFQTVQRVAGAMSAEENIDEETHGMEIQKAGRSVEP